MNRVQKLLVCMIALFVFITLIVVTAMIAVVLLGRL